MSTSTSPVFKRFLVTGAAGLLGRELTAQLLKEGHEVIALKHNAAVDINHPALKVIPCDILDITCLEDCLQEVDAVFHCAALVSFQQGSRDSLFKINIDGTANVVNACLVAGVKKLVHTSSVSALGRTRPGVSVNESMHWTDETSNSVYGKSKYFGEMEVWRGMGEGLPVAVVCPSHILGGNNWDDGSSAIFKSAWNEFPWYAPGGGGFVDVRDVARAMIVLMKSDIEGEKFILNAENLGYRYVFDTIAQCFNKKKPTKKVSPFLAEIVWRMEQLKATFSGGKSLLTKETARTAMTTVQYDNSKFLETFPSFQYTPIGESIRFTCNAMKENYRLK